MSAGCALALLALCISAAALAAGEDVCGGGNLLDYCQQLIGQGDIAGALSVGSQWIAQRPRCVDAFQCRGAAYFTGGAMVDAMADFEKVPLALQQLWRATVCEPAVESDAASLSTCGTAVHHPFRVCLCVRCTMLMRRQQS
jgi:hypothetical protein